MSVGAEGIYDAILQDREVNPRVALGLVLAYQDNGQGDIVKGWQESRVPPLPPRRSTGALTWSHKDPLSDFVYAQDDWSEGAFRPYYRDLDRRYAKSDGVDLRWEGVAALGPKLGTPRTSVPNAGRITSNFLLANGTFEEGLTSGWAAGTGATHTVETSVVRTGTYSAKVVVAQSTSAGDILSQTLANPTVYRSRQIVVIAYVRRAAGSDAGILLRVADGVGSTDSSAITTDAWSSVIVTRTIDANATAITISLRHDATTSTDEHTFYIDDIHVIPTGGVQCVGSATRGSTDPDEIYLAVGRCIVYWEESTFRWSMGFINTVVATDIELFNDVIYVAYGNSSTGSQYVYGTTTSWTTAALNATTNHQDNHATYFTKALNSASQLTLWKAGPATAGGTEVNAVFWATDPTSSWQPDSPFRVGSSDRAITKLHSFQGLTLVVAKVDGIWIWSSSLSNFFNLTQEWENALSEENGKIGAYWQGALYLSSVRQGFHRISNVITDLSDILLAPRLTDFGGKVTAMVPSPRHLWLGLDTPTADKTEGKTSRLVVYSIVNGENKIHTIHELTMSVIDELTFHLDTRLWAVGRAYDSDNDTFFFAAALCFQPDKVAAPFADVTPASGATPNVVDTGFFETSIWHGGAPETNKAIIAITIWCEDLDTEHTIAVAMGKDGAAASTTAIGTFSSSATIQTLYLKDINDPQENATARFVQLRFTFTSDDSTSPKMYAYALHTQLAPEPIRLWTLLASVGEKTLLRTDIPFDQTKGEMRSLLAALEAQVFPLTLVEDFDQAHDGIEVDGGRRHQVRLIDHRKTPTSSDEDGEDIWQLVLQEVPVDNGN